MGAVVRTKGMLLVRIQSKAPNLNFFPYLCSMNKIKLKSESVIIHKLQFVKLVKDYTHLGLKEAKFVCDNLCENIGNSE